MGRQDALRPARRARARGSSFRHPTGDVAISLRTTPPQSVSDIPGLAPPPEVDWPRSRLLERRQLLRSLGLSASVLATDAGVVDLEVARTEPRIWSGRPDFRAPGPISTDPALMRVEVLNARTLRVRFGLKKLPLGDEPALDVQVASLVPTGPLPIVEPGSVTLEIGNGSACVGLDPIRIEVFDETGRSVASIGGREKNFFGMWDAWPTGVSITEEGEPVAHETFALRPGEAIWGLGEQYTAFNRVGQTIDLTAEEAHGTGTRRAYKNIPFWISSHGYGLYVNQSARMSVWVGSLSAGEIQLGVEDDHLDMFVFLGSPKEILSAYTDLTGRATVPPRWSFGFWQSKISYRSTDEVLDVVKRQRAAGVPVDVVHVDTHWFREDWRCDLEFDPERFPDPAGLCRDLDELGVKLSIWQLPYIPEGSSLFNEINAVDGFVRDATGEIYDIGICLTPGFTGRVGCIDLTNPRAVSVWQGRLARVLEVGAAVIKADFGELAPLDGVWHDATQPHLMHNRYPLLYNRAVAEVSNEVTGSPMIWARSAWAGSQRYPVHWGGDSSAEWDAIAPLLAGGLGLGMCGFSFWGQDIGGFAGLTGGEMLVRWMQLGVMLSHARIHGMGAREIDSFDEPVRGFCRDAIRFRYSLLPYLLATARDSAAEGLPMARPLALEFPDDPTTWPIADQWLLGDGLMVAPILDASGRRRAYLPAGRWGEWSTGEIVQGGRWIDIDVPIDRTAIWIRDGHPIPTGPVMDHVDQRPIDRLEVRLLPLNCDGSGELVVPVSDDASVDLRYVSTSGGENHRLLVSGSAIEITVTGPGRHAVPVEVVYADG